MAESTKDRWRNVAKLVAERIRKSGIGVFRHAVIDTMNDRVANRHACEKREKERLDALKADGVLSSESIPERPDSECFLHSETIRGSIDLSTAVGLVPSQLTEQPQIDAWLEEHAQRLYAYVKRQGFPAHNPGEHYYRFDVHGWLPDSLNPNADPQPDELLPIPRREVTEAEKLVVLAAVYDAHWPGGEKISPWGVTDDSSIPEGLNPDLEPDERLAALEYFVLFRTARTPDDADENVVRSWLSELPAELKEQTYLDMTLGDRDIERFDHGKRVTCDFGGKRTSWTMVRILFEARHEGLSREDIAQRVWPAKAVSENNLDKHKATANGILETIGVEIMADNRGVWRLKDIPRPEDS